MKSDIKNLDQAGLMVELLKLKEEQFKLRMQRNTGQLVQTHLIKLCRKKIARIKTALNAKSGVSV